MHRMIGKVYKQKKVRVIVRHSEDIKVVIATSNHIDKSNSSWPFVNKFQTKII
jgi:hypothetical protein